MTQNHTYVDDKSLKTLEDLSIFLTTGIMTLQTLHNLQVRAIEIGIMPEDMNERANTIAWDLRRLMTNYKTQLEAALALIPDEFDPIETIKKLQTIEKKKARSMLKAAKEKK